MSLPRKGLMIAAALLLILATVSALLYARFLGDSETVRVASQAIEQRDFDRAARLLDAYLEGRSDPAARLLAAQAARRFGDFPHALSHLQTYERVHGTDAALAREYQLLAVQQGEPSAVQDASTACCSEPLDSHQTLLLEALIVADLNRLAVPFSEELPIGGEPPAELTRLLETTEFWLESRSSPPDQAQGLVWRGRARGLSSDHSGAVSDYNRALELDPLHFEARAYLALSIAQQRPQEALAHLELLHQRFPEDVRITYSVATTYRRLGNPAKAAELLDEVLHVLPNHTQVLIQRGLAEIDQRRARRALDYLLRAQSISPESSEAQAALSRCMTMLNDPIAARRHQERFLALEEANQHPTDPAPAAEPMLSSRP